MSRQHSIIYEVTSDNIEESEEEIQAFINSQIGETSRETTTTIEHCNNNTNQLDIFDYFKITNDEPRVRCIELPRVLTEEYNNLIYKFELEIAKNNFNIAEEYINQAISKIPFYPYGYFRKASLFWSIGDYRTHIRNLVYGIYTCTDFQNNFEKYKNIYKEMEEYRSEVFQNNYFNIDYWLCLFGASMALQEKKQQLCIKSYENALEFVLSEDHQVKLANSDLNTVLHRYECFYTIYNWLGIAHSDMERFDLEIDFYKKALDTNFNTETLPKLEQFQLAGLFNNIGGGLFSMNNPMQAIEQYNMGSSYFSEHSLLFLNRADAYHQLGKFKEAILDFEKCTALCKYKETMIDYLVNLADSYFSIGNFKRANQIFMDCYQKYGIKRASPFLVEVDMLSIWQQDSDKFLRFLNEAIDNVGDNVQMLKRLLIRKYFLEETDELYDKIVNFQNGLLERIS